MAEIPIIAPAAPDSSLQYEALYAMITPLQDSYSTQSLPVDMSSISFVYVDGLLALTCIARLWHRWTGYRLRLQHLDPKVHRYLERMDLFSQCSEWLEQDRLLDEGDRFNRKPYSERLMEVTPIPSDEQLNEGAVQEALHRMRAILDSSTSRDPTSVIRLCTMLSEITQNVVHSLDQGFAIVQRYRTPGSAIVQNYRVLISVVDLGIGIESSLRRSPVPLLLDNGAPLISGSDYILKALEVGVTSRASGGGLGLHHVRGLVQEWRGTLTIRSGRSRVQISSDTLTRTDALAEIPGTQVTIEVHGT
jgi:hypothetical protein